MTEPHFVALRHPRWEKFDQIISRKKKARFRNPAEAIALPSLYRAICADLNRAKAEGYSFGLIENLNRMVWEGHQILYRGDRERRTLLALAADFPGTVRKFAGLFLLCNLLFYGSVGLTYAFVAQDQNRAVAILGPDMSRDLKQMYDPSGGTTLRPNGVTSDADMFGFYIGNNMSVGFRTFAGGLLAGIGSLFFLVYNGVYMGAAMALIDANGFSGTFYPFVLGHGAFELTATIIFALAGFLLGRAVLMPGRLSRSEALRTTGVQVIPLVAGATAFLFIAACLEAFWSARVTEPLVKYAAAVFFWGIVIVFLAIGGRRGNK